MASMASGIGLPPRIKTPSISKAKAKVSADSASSVGVAGVCGVAGELMAGEEAVSSTRFLANSSDLACERDAAKLPW